MKGQHAKNTPPHQDPGQSMADALMARAHALIDVRRLSDAVLLLHQVLAIEPDRYEAHCFLGECLWKLRRTDEAISAFERAVAKRPDEEMAFSLMAWVLIEKCEQTRLSRWRYRKRALEMAQTAIRLDPESPRALAAMSGVQLHLYSARKALPYIEHHLRVQPDQHYAYGNMAAAKFRLRRWKEAESFARRALEINPRAVTTMATLGAVLLSKRRYREAIKVLNQALAIDPDHLNAKHNLALAAQKLLKDGNPADLPDGTRKSRQQIWIEIGISVMVVVLFLLTAFLVRLIWMKGQTYGQALGTCLMFASAPGLIGFTIWRRREFNRLPKGTQMLLQKASKRKYPWLP